MQTLRAFVAAWREAANFNNPMTAGELKTFAEEAEGGGDGEYHQRHTQIFAHPAFHQAALDIASRNGEIDARRLGHYLKRYMHRIVDGCKIMGEEDTHSKQKRWWLKSTEVETSGLSRCG